MGDRTGVYRILVGRSEGRRTLGKPSRRWEDYIKMYLQRWDREAWTGLIWLRIGDIGWRCKCGNERSGSIECGEFID